MVGGGGWVMLLVLLSLAAMCWSALPREPTIQCGSETASIRLLKATKICVTGKSNMDSYDCVRCNYTEAFQSQTRPSGGKWTFSYVGFPVQLSTLYFIGAHNIPNANMNEDSPSLSVNFTSPGSLWDPNITACKKNEETVEVKFTTNPLVNKYSVLILQDMPLGYAQVLENKLTRTSVAIQVNGESEGAMVHLTPFFPACGSDCIRREGKVVLCPERSATDNRRSTKTSFPTTNMLLPLIKVLVVYPSDICFHHTVCRFTDFLQNHCRSEVILEKWQKKKIAEMGPVQWLTTQKQAADKVIFLLSSDVHSLCDSACGQNEGSTRENSQDLFPLAFNLFCSDFSTQAHLHKYLVVYLGGADIKGDYNALSVCPQYRLMKDATAFHTELLKATQNMSRKKRSQPCPGSCSLL
ncbi:Interleukin-17 receptor B [Cricetulus griseus]|uniref:Interleukin-17 receptor B n=1 Tax=Cricetulus griseus TaxID=10029 RepID=G3GUU1_CRIGR|nr:Interleukin-17 receptor B [Cricetulus griseus]ERE89924.1 interleukin-17 receptor B [Cricetulus griseus]